MTELLREWQNGRQEAAEELFERLYPELRRIARRQMRRERHNHTLQPTALVNEAYLQLARQRKLGQADRSHFVAIASRIMQRLLCEMGRSRQAQRRKAVYVTLHTDDASVAAVKTDVVDLNSALAAFASRYPFDSEVVMLKFFGGMSTREIATQLGRSTATIERAWRFARAWLYSRIEES